MSRPSGSRTYSTVGPVKRARPGATGDRPVAPAAEGADTAASAAVAAVVLSSRLLLITTRLRDDRL
ncbi:hypothetical protein ACFWXD_34025 [[Kitasatospora] papulosa]|uniref:hypothetical protein n=1 Tax=[Kitasatospora] papulosa TaxID=1464011 RepID=UPI0036ACB8BC